MSIVFLFFLLQFSYRMGGEKGEYYQYSLPPALLQICNHRNTSKAAQNVPPFNIIVYILAVSQTSGISKPIAFAYAIAISILL